MDYQIETNEKIKMNAISAYLMIVANIFFLFGKSNPLLHNSFVKSHTKSALTIHAAIAFIIIVFLWFQLFGGIYIFSIALSNIIASSFLLGLFGVILYGIFKAHKGEYFTVGEMLHLAKTEKIIDINNDHTLDEKDKLTIILAYVPLLGYLVYGMYSENSIIKNITKFNLLSSLIIACIFTFGHQNLSIFLSLIYIIFVVFTSIILVGKNEIFSINLEQVPTFEKAEMYLKAGVKYIVGFFGKNFSPLKETIKNLETKKTNDEKLYNEELALREKFTWSTYSIYLPLLNIITLWKIKSDLRTHIINGVTLSLLVILSWGVFGINNNYQYLILFPLFYGIAFLKIKKDYKLPFIYCVGESIFFPVEKGIDKLIKAKNTHKTEALKPQK